MKVSTNKGLIDLADLVVNDVVTYEQNARVTSTEWMFNNELVRRDLNINMLTGLSLGTEENLNG